MAWCFSTRASVATVLTTHPCISRCLRVNQALNPMHSSKLSPADPSHKPHNVSGKYLTMHHFVTEMCTYVKENNQIVNVRFVVRRAGLLWSQQDFEWRWFVPLFKCLTVLEFSFILFDLCLLITFFNFIMNHVPIVTFWIFTYHKIWILSIMFCFIWSYWIIYFLACLEVSWRVVS